MVETLDACVGPIMNCPTKKDTRSEHLQKLYTFTYGRLLLLQMQQLTENVYAFVEKRDREKLLFVRTLDTHVANGYSHRYRRFLIL